MNLLFLYLLYLATLLAPALYAFVIRNRVLPENKPVLYYMWAQVFLEVTQVFFSFESPVRIVSGNLQYLADFLLVTWIAYRWKTFDRLPWLLPVLVMGGLLALALEKSMVGWHARLSWVRVSFSFISALLATEMLSRTLVGRPGPLSRNPVFLLSLGLLLNYALAAIFELVVLTGGMQGQEMARPLFYYTISVGIPINIIYLIALLCLSTRTRFSFR